MQSHRHGQSVIIVARGTLAFLRLKDGVVNWVHRE